MYELNPKEFIVKWPYNLALEIVLGDENKALSMTILSIYNLINELPERDLKIILMRFKKYESYRDISKSYKEDTGIYISPSKCRSIIITAIKILRLSFSNNDAIVTSNIIKGDLPIHTISTLRRYNIYSLSDLTYISKSQFLRIDMNSGEVMKIRDMMIKQGLMFHEEPEIWLTFNVTDIDVVDIENLQLPLPIIIQLYKLKIRMIYDLAYCYPNKLVDTEIFTDIDMKIIKDKLIENGLTFFNE